MRVELNAYGRDWIGEEVRGWLLSEKMDGMRVHVRDRLAFSRNGHDLDLGPVVIPAFDCDCELWAGRDVPRSRVVAAAMAVDKTMDHRAMLAECALYPFAPKVLGQPRFTWSGIAGWLRHILAMGGEGLMAAHPQGVPAGRSDRLLKLKAEALPLLERLAEREPEACDKWAAEVRACSGE